MTKTEAKKIALETMMESIGTAYYKICDDTKFTDEEIELISVYLTQYGERISKSLGTTYITY